MRIGEFAEKHGVTQDTIRYYLEMGLLVSKKKGGQYQFSESDGKDLEQIMELKKLDFSLTDIQKILSFQRISGTSTDVFRRLYLPFLEAKKEEVDKELVKYNKMNEYLTLRIDEMKQQELGKGDKLGIPMSALKILVCPLCERPLSISDGTIQDHMIMKANIQCECGYRANINHGILIDESALRTKMLDGKKMPSKEEFLNSSSHVHVNFIYKGMATLIEYINKYQTQAEYILEMDNCVGFFLLQYIKYLPSNSTYILVEYDLERLLHLKRNLEMYYDHHHFIFLCCDLNRLPISKAAIDIAVDAQMSRAFAQSHGEFLLDHVYPLIKDRGLLVGNYLYAGPNSKGTPPLSALARELLIRERILEKLEAKGLQSIELTDIGPIFENSQSNRELNDIERYQLVYAGKKYG